MAEKVSASEIRKRIYTVLSGSDKPMDFERIYKALESDGQNLPPDKPKLIVRKILYGTPAFVPAGKGLFVVSDGATPDNLTAAPTGAGDQEKGPKSDMAKIMEQKRANMISRASESRKKKPSSGGGMASFSDGVASLFAGKKKPSKSKSGASLTKTPARSSAPSSGKKPAKKSVKKEDVPGVKVSASEIRARIFDILKEAGKPMDFNQIYAKIESDGKPLPSDKPKLVVRKVLYGSGVFESSGKGLFEVSEGSERPEVVSTPVESPAVVAPAPPEDDTTPVVRPAESDKPIVVAPPASPEDDTTPVVRSAVSDKPALASKKKESAPEKKSEVDPYAGMSTEEAVKLAAAEAAREAIAAAREAATLAAREAADVARAEAAEAAKQNAVAAAQQAAADVVQAEVARQAAIRAAREAAIEASKGAAKEAARQAALDVAREEAEKESKQAAIEAAKKIALDAAKEIARQEAVKMAAAAEAIKAEKEAVAEDQRRVDAEIARQATLDAAVKAEQEAAEAAQRMAAAELAKKEAIDAAAKAEEEAAVETQRRVMAEALAAEQREAAAVAARQAQNACVTQEYATSDLSTQDVAPVAPSAGGSGKSSIRERIVAVIEIAGQPQSFVDIYSGLKNDEFPLPKNDPKNVVKKILGNPRIFIELDDGTYAPNYDSNE